EAAGPAYDRHGAVAQAVHLVETARLVERRHEEHVGACFDQVREFVAVAPVEAHAIRKLLLEHAEELLVARLAITEHGEAQVVAAEQPWQHVEEQVEALLSGEARDDTDER